MHMPARPARQPVADQWRLVRGVVVDDEMHVEIARHVRLDLVEEFAELGGTMAREALSDHPPGGDIEGGEQRGCAMAGAVGAAPRRPAGAPGPNVRGPGARVRP